MSSRVAKQAVLLLLGISACSFPWRAAYAAEGPVAWWSFEAVNDGAIIDRAAQYDDRVEGNAKLIGGPVGKALLFDGFTAVIDRPAADAPECGRCRRRSPAQPRPAGCR